MRRPQSAKILAFYGCSTTQNNSSSNNSMGSSNLLSNQKKQNLTNNSKISKTALAMSHQLPQSTKCLNVYRVYFIRIVQKQMK